MARTLAQVRGDVQRNVGRSDATMNTIIDRSVNMAIEALMVLLDMPELHTTLSQTVNANDASFTVASTDRLIDIAKIRNTTDARDLGFIPFELLDRLIPANETALRYFSRKGNVVHIRAAAPAQKALTLYVTQFPAQISSDATAVPFEGHDAQLVAVATAITWAGIEESDSSSMWAQIAQILGVSTAQAMVARQIIEGLPESKEAALNIGKAQGGGG